MSANRRIIYILVAAATLICPCGMTIAVLSRWTESGAVDTSQIWMLACAVIWVALVAFIVIRSLLAPAPEAKESAEAPEPEETIETDRDQ